MTKAKPTTLLVFVQDETGSMNSRREVTIFAFNEYFDTLKKDAKGFGKVTVHAWQFSEGAGEDRVRMLHQGALKTTPKLDEATYRPRGVTPLLDAVGTALQQASAVKADRYLFVVQTDGEENASKDFTRDQIEVLVKEKEAADNWTLVFLGAGLTEWHRQVGSMGAAMTSTTSIPADARSTTNAYASLSSHSSALLSSDAVMDSALASKVESDVKKKAKPVS